MTIWSSSSTNAAGTSAPTTRGRHRRGRSRVTALAMTWFMVTLALLVPATAQAATPTLTVTLSAVATPGNPAVAFTATIGGSAVGDSAYLCFGDEAPVVCDATHPGTAVDMTAATAVGGAAVSHTYAAEGSFTAVLYEVSGTTVTASPASTVVVTIDGTARLTATTNGLTAILDGSTSTAAAGDSWWACFGDNPKCGQAAPDASGTVAAGAPPLNKVSHTYAKPAAAAGFPAGYPASLTVIGTTVTSAAALPVLVNFPDPTAILTSDSATGTGSLPVIFDGSQSSVSAGDSWAFCFGDVAGCSATTPDLSGSIGAGAPTVALPTTAHRYGPGNYTATLWVSKPGSTTSTATVPIAVGNPVAAPDGTCTLSGIIRTCDLYAKGNGTVTAGPDSIAFWGFTTSDTAAPVLGGPTLIATEGEELAFTVHNQLDPRAGNVAITVPALAGAPDLTGIAPGSSGGSGSFTLTKPGTYIYEAGLTSGGARQVAMGLSGVLIVRPSVLTSANSVRCAYDAAVNTDCLANKDARNYFDREKVVKVNELDAAFTADPFGSDTGDYHPSNYFIDGVAYDPAKPALDPAAPTFDAAVNSVRLDAAPGDSVLLRYADLGLREHSMNLLNLVQSETARDANVLPTVTAASTEFLNAGQTADTFLTIPPGAVTGTKYPLFDAGMHLNNGAGGGVGGMYTYLDVVNGATAADVGPVGSAASAVPTFTGSVPNVDNGQVPSLRVTGVFAAKGTAAVSSVQWALDVPSPDGLWQPSGAVIPTGSGTATVGFTISQSDLTQQLGTEPDRIFGDHTIWLQAVDSNGKPGPVVGASFSLAMRDAVISTLAINPQVTNGTTGSNQLPVAATKISVLSNDVNVPATVLHVNSTAGFPGTCDTGGCLITVGMTIADGPAQGDLVYQSFTYTKLTPNSFTGLVPSSPVARNTYVFSTGNTVALDVVPAGFIAINATATASLPGWVVHGAQACVLYAAGAVPGPADQVETKCNPANKKAVTDLGTNAVDSLVAVNGFLPPPTLPNGVNNAANFWVMVRALEGPDGTPCTVSGACRYSPWLYYHPVTTTVTTTRALAQDNVFVASTVGFPSHGRLTATTTTNLPATINYYNTDPTTFLTDNGGSVPGTLAAGAVVTGSAAGPDTYQTLTLVKAGPKTTLATLSPNPNNGFDAAAGNLGLFDSFDVQATATSQWADIALAEAFVAPTSRARGAPAPALRRCSVKPGIPAGCVTFGQGAEMTPADGLWGNSLSKDVTAFLPLSLLQGMPDGLVRVWVHAKDIAGNWGPFEAVDLVLDRTAPVVDSVTNTATTLLRRTTAAATLPLVGGVIGLGSVAGLPTTGGTVAVTTSTGVQMLTYTGVTVGTKTLTGVSGGTAGAIAKGAAVTTSGVASVSANDVNSAATGLVSSGVAGAEWFVGADPGPGNGTKAVTVPVTLPTRKNSATVLTFSITGLPVGKTVSVRVVDAAGNWSTAKTVVM